MVDSAYLWTVAWNMALVLFLVFLNGFFVAAEFAIVKVREGQIRSGIGGSRRAAALHIHDHLDAYLSACQLGITIASLGLGWIGEPAISRLLVEPIFGRLLTEPGAVQAVSFTIAFIIITALHIVIGELAPKSLAIRKPVTTTAAVALPLRAFRKLFWPLISSLNAAAIFVIRLIGVTPVTASEAEHSIDELRILLARAASRESKLPRSAQAASRVFGLTELETRDIMVPRDRMVVLDVRKTFDENFGIVKKNPFTRFPLSDGGPDSILGFLHQRDVFAAAEQRPPPRLDDLRREVLIVPTTQAVNVTLFEMLERRRTMAIVVNEFGVTVGLLTLDDIFEEILGEIPGDFARPTAQLRVLAPGQYLVDASLPLRELQLVLKEPIEDPRATTLAGLLINAMGRIPAKGETVRIGNYSYWVTEADRHKVRLVEIRRVETD